MKEVEFFKVWKSKSMKCYWEKFCKLYLEIIIIFLEVHELSVRFCKVAANILVVI